MSDEYEPLTETAARVFPKPKLAEVYQAVADAPPDEAAKVLTISQKTGQPADFVHENLAALGRATSAPTVNEFHNIETAHPVVGNFLSRPDHMAVSYDDTHNLVKHSTLIQKATRAYNALTAAFVAGNLGVERDFASYEKMMGPSFDPDPRASRVLSSPLLAGSKPEDRMEQIDKHLAELEKDAPEHPGIAASMALGLAHFAPMAADMELYAMKGAAAGGALGLGVTAATGGIGVPSIPAFTAAGAGAGIAQYFFKQMAGSAYAKWSKEKDANGNPLDPNIVKAASLMVGAAAAPLAVVSLGKIAGEAGESVMPVLGKALEKVPGGKAIFEKLTGSMSPKIMRSTVGRSQALWTAAKELLVNSGHAGIGMGGFAAAELLGEQTVKAVSNDKFGTAFPRKTPGEMAGQVASSALEGALTFMPISAIAPIMGLRSNLHDTKMAEQTKQVLSELLTAREDSKVRVRMPDLYNKFNQDVLRGSPLENVHVDREKMERLFQADNIDPATQFKAMGLSDAYAESKATGAPIRIPTALWLSDKVPAQLPAKLIDDTKLDPEHLTVNEIKQVAQAQREKTQAEAEMAQKEGAEAEKAVAVDPKVREGHKTIYAEQLQLLTDQFAGQKIDKKALDDSAKAIANHYVAEAVLRKADPVELYKRDFGGYAGGGATGGALLSEPIYPILSGHEAEARPAEGQPGAQPAGGSGGEPAGQGKDGAPLQAPHQEALAALPQSSPGPTPPIKLAARMFVKSKGLPFREQASYVKADPERGKRIADAFEAMPHSPKNPQVRQAYDALIAETLEQFQVVKAMGLKIEAIKPGQANPYPGGSADFIADMRKGHLWFFPTEQGFGSDARFNDHPLFEMTNEKLKDGTPLRANDIFRIVHDFFGHAKEGVGIGAHGEENAWNSHVRMYSPLAAWAMTSETRGQNSWVNYGPHGEQNRADPKNTIFADQKAGLLPAWVMTEGIAPDKEGPLYQEQNAPTFYSKLQRDIETRLSEKATKGQVEALLRDVKEDERKWSGIDAFLKGKEKINKTELLDFLRANQFTVEERVLGEPAAPESQDAKAIAAPNENGIIGGVGAFKRWAAGQGFTEDDLNRKWAHRGRLGGRDRLVKQFAEQHPDLMAERDINAIQPTEAEFREWANQEGYGRNTIITAWNSREDSSAYREFLEARRVAAGGLPSIESLDSDELREKVEEQYDDEINERSGELESEAIDEQMSEYSHEWTVEVEPVISEAQSIDDITKTGEGQWTVYFDNGHAKDYTVESEDAASELAQQDLNYGGLIPGTENGYKLTLNGQDYSGRDVYDSNLARRRRVQTFFDDEREAEREAERATENESDSYREGMYDNDWSHLHREAIDEFVDKVENGELDLEGFHSPGKEPKAPKKKLFKWDKARYPSGGSYALAGAEPGSEREIIFHAPKVEPYNPSDTTHFGDISLGQDIGWTRTAIHRDDSGNRVRLANEFQNNRTQRGAAEGYKGEGDEAHAKWSREYEDLVKARRAASGMLDKLDNELRVKYNEAHTRPTDGDAYDKWHEDRVAFIVNDPEYKVAQNAFDAATAAEYASGKAEPKKGTVPETPFKNNSYEFQFKRLLSWHIDQDYKAWQESNSEEPFLEWWKDNGVKKLAWTTGMMQAERNSRAEDVDKLVYDPVKQELSAYKNGRKVVDSAKMAPDAIAERLGGSPQAQEIAKRLLAAESKKSSPLTTEEYNAKADAIREKIRGAETGRDEETYQQELAKFEESHADEGMHVIHDEGGVKVAANAKFFTDLYDKKIPSFVKKFTKAWGGNVGEAMIKTAEQGGAYRFEGPEPGLMALEKHGRDIAGSDWTDSTKSAMRGILEWMKTGGSFSEAIAREANSSGFESEANDIAELFGGKMVQDKARRHERVHALEITPEIVQASITQGFPLFQKTHGYFEPDTRMIGLLKTANASTIMHEWGHAWAQSAFDFVKSGQATQDYLDHWEPMKKWLGVTAEQDKLTVPQQEKFARGFEAYLMEGKAPSEELRGMFDRFRRWLTQTYRNLAGLEAQAGQKIDLSDEARGFFDRLLATEDEIQRAQELSGYRPEEIGAIEDADPASADRVRTLQERARAKAEDILVREQMKEYAQEHREMLGKERERLTAKEREAVEASPLYSAMLDIEENRPGAHRTAATLAPEFLGNKLSPQEMAAFEAAAEIHGFADGTDLAQTIIADSEVGGLQATVKQRVEKAMLPLADLRNRDAIREAALRAVNNDLFGELLALEQQIYTTMVHDKEVRGEVTKRSRIEAKVAYEAVKNQARELLESKNLRDAGNYRIYMTAARNAAVRVSEAVNAGKFEDVAKAKEQQRIAQALFSEAMKNRTEIAKAGKFFDKFAKRGGDLLNMPYAFVRQIDNLLAANGIIEPKTANDAVYLTTAQVMLSQGRDAGEIANATGYVKDEAGRWVHESLPQFVQRLNDNNYAFSLPQSVAQRAGPLMQVNRDLTLGEMRDLRATIKRLNGIGTKFEAYLSGFIKGDVRTNAAKFAADVARNIGAPHGAGPLLGEVEMSRLASIVDSIKAIPDGMISSKVNLLTLCEFLDRLDPDGEAKNNIYRPLRAAENAERTTKLAKAKELHDIRSRHYNDREWDAMDETFDAWEVPIKGKPTRVRLTKENALILALHQGTESNLQRVLDGFHITEERLKSITDRLDKRDWDYVKDIWTYVGQFWPAISELEMRVNGYEPTKVPGRQVDTPHGTYPGQYFPLAYDFEKSSDALKNAEQRNTLFKEYSAAAAHTAQGFLQQRVANLSRPLRLTFDGLFNHLDDVIHDLSYRPAVIDVARFLNQPDAKAAILNAVGLDGYKTIQQVLKVSASKQAEFLSPGEQKIRWFRFATTFATLSYRPLAFAKNALQNMDLAMREVGPMNFLGKMGDFMLNPSAITEFIRARSVVMSERGLTRERDLMELSQEWRGRDSRYKMFAFLHDTLADRAMSNPAWMAVYETHLPEFGDKRASELADESIIKTFGSGSIIDRVGAQRGGELNRIMSMYYSWTSMLFNRAWLQGKIAGLEYGEGNYGKATTIVANTVAMTWVVPALNDIMWSEIARNVPSGAEDEDDKKKRRIQAIASVPFSYFPIGRSAAALAIPLALGRQPHGGYQLSPAEGAIEDILKTAGHGVHTMFDDSKEFDKKFAEEAARAASVLIGAPTILTTWTMNFKDWLDNEGELAWRDFISRRKKK